MSLADQDALDPMNFFPCEQIMDTAHSKKYVAEYIYSEQKLKSVLWPE
jgi:hypothetical protein